MRVVEIPKVLGLCRIICTYFSRSNAERSLSQLPCIDKFRICPIQVNLELRAQAESDVDEHTVRMRHFRVAPLGKMPLRDPIDLILISCHCDSRDKKR